MTTEELMNPRYKVIADYPNSPFNIGEILLLKSKNCYESNLDKQIYTDRYPEKYPHLFKPLAWPEERKPEDMPEYLKPIEEFNQWPGLILKVASVYPNAKSFRCENIFQLAALSFSDYVPATLSDYLTYKQSNQ